MKGLIIAAGQGTRIKDKGDIKPLIPLLDVVLIERVIRTANKGGISSFFVVTGYKHEELCANLQDISDRTGIQIDTIYNGEWQLENGLSVLKAKPYLNERFVLTMSDHMFDTSIIKHLLSAVPLTSPDESTFLCVDRNLLNPYVDMDDVTKVREENNHILDIGKNISDFNCFDTGIFSCTPALFEAIERSSKEYGDKSLSGGLRVLGESQKAKIFDVTGSFWIDVDNEDMYSRAESFLQSNQL